MKIVICGLLKYPAGDAGSLRQHKCSIMLRELGHEVLVVGLGPANGRMETVHDGTKFISLRYGDTQIYNKVISHICYWNNLKKCLGTHKPDAIIMDDLGLLKTVFLKRFCKRKHIRLIHDSVEWYSQEQFNHGKFSWGYIRKDLLNRFLIDESCGVIAISSYLYNYFSGKGCTCVRIPIVVSEEDLSGEKKLPDDKVVFTYAGQPGKKDYLHVMLEAFALLPDELLCRAVFNIVGCTKEQMLAAGINEAVLEKLDKQLVIHGRVSHAEVLRILESTHFTLLMRSPVQRYAKAGFPTKVVESLSCSTPVICNLTSDLGEYLTDSVDSLIAVDCSADALRKCLETAISLPESERRKMCNQAELTARKYFMYYRYLEKLKELL